MISTNTNNLISDLDNNFNEWEFSEHRASKNGLRIWIANGFTMCNPSGGAFNLIEKYYVFKAIHRARINKSIVKAIQ
jgi:uncharacterized protein with ParB-like and HNH nuclease domain